MEGIEEIKMDIKTKELRRKTLVEGDFDKIVIKAYWDSHGTEIPWEDDNQTFEKSHAKLESVITRWEFEYTEPSDMETWDLTIDNKKINGDITSYRISPNGRNLTLHSCIGAG